MAEVVVSLHAIDPEQTVRDVQRAVIAGANWVELRLDLWPRDVSVEILKNETDVRLIAACRMPRDGGAYRGSLRDRRALLDSALTAGFDGIDLEGWEDWEPDRLHILMTVRSYFCFTETPREVVSIRDALLDRGADVARIVTMAHDLADAAPLVDLLANTDQLEEGTTAYAMGKAAASTRVLGAALGAPLVYARSDFAEETMPGEPFLREIRGLYGARSKSARTEIFGEIGRSLEGSLAPYLYNRALRKQGLDAVFLPFETSRPREVVKMLAPHGLAGLTVRGAYKRSLVEICDILSSEAEAVGAVNILCCEESGRITGHNTEVTGVRRALRRAGLGLGTVAETAVVLGSGGTARAAAISLQQMGYSVMMMARSLEPIRAFTQSRQMRLASLRAELLRDESPTVLVHATPVGADGVTRLLPEWSIPRDCTVLDMLYTCSSTPWLDTARAAGATAVSGLEAYLTQAAEQLRWLTDEHPEEEELRGYLAGAIR